MQRDGVRTITKKELSDRIADRTGASRASVRRVVQSFLDEIVEELARGNRIEFREFGVFEIKSRAPRIAQNPRTLERVCVPERRSVKFKPSRKMRDTIDHAGAAPMPEPKAGVRPDTTGIGDHPARRRAMQG